jgi:hypothetical protein
MVLYYFLRASPAALRYHPHLHKTVILGKCATFSSPAVPQYLLLFLVAINISLISPQRKEEIQFLQYHEDHPNYHFSTIFSLTLLWDPHFI